MADANPSRPTKQKTELKTVQPELKASKPLNITEAPKGPKPVKITDLTSGHRLIRY